MNRENTSYLEQERCSFCQVLGMLLVYLGSVNEKESLNPGWSQTGSELTDA